MLRFRALPELQAKRIIPKKAGLANTARVAGTGLTAKSGGSLKVLGDGAESPRCVQEVMP
jgi:hypothetical protein